MHKFKELETQLIIAKELKYVSTSDLDSISQDIDEISKMIAGLKKALYL